MSDGNIHCITDGRALRKKAIGWLEDKEKHAAEYRLVEQFSAVQAENEAFRRRIEKLELNQAPAKPKSKRRRCAPLKAAKELEQGEAA